jgi:hypothetical protein
MPHYLDAVTPLTENSPRAPTPPGFKGKLWEPQATVLQAMLDLEKRPFLRLRLAHGEGDYQPLLRVKTARLAEKLSFGKTVVAIALICASKAPRAFPSPATLVSVGGAAENVLTRRYSPGGRGAMALAEIKYPRLIRATLVIVGTSVMTQWENAIRKFAPHLKTYTIENVRSLKSFSKVFKSPEMDSIDIVLLKAGRVTTSFVVAGEKKPRGKQRAISTALSRVTEGYSWARSIIDDYDTIPLASDDYFLPALFTWVVSATARHSVISQYARAGDTVQEFLRENIRVRTLQPAFDAQFKTVLKLCCTTKYIENHLDAKVAEYRVIVVKGGHAAVVLRDLGVPQDALEMIAAGAIETASERLGIKVSTVGELVERILNKKVELYKRAITVLDRIEKIEEKASSSQGESISGDEANALRAMAKRGSDEAMDEALEHMVGRSSSKLAAAMKSLRKWADGQIEKFGGELARMRENVKQGHCQACMVPIEGETYIMNCCQILVCGYCVLAENGKTFIKKCPNCARPINPKLGLICVSSDLKATEMLSDKPLLKEKKKPEKQVENQQSPGAEDPVYGKWREQMRLRALLQLIRGDPVSCLKDEKVDPFVKDLLQGRVSVPLPPKAPKKFLIFTMYVESARRISEALAELKIAYVHLRGSRKKKDAAIEAFKRGGINVMLATSSKDCNGIHLPEVTHVVLYHHHVNTHIEKQAIGRAQRVGRKYSLQVVKLLNEGESHRVCKRV